MNNSDNSLETLQNALNAVRVVKAKESKSIPISALLGEAEWRIEIAMRQVQRIDTCGVCEKLEGCQFSHSANDYCHEFQRKKLQHE